MKELLDTIKHFRDIPFAWGTADCCCFAAHYIEQVTGKDLRSPYGNYRTERGSKKAQVQHGTFTDLMDSHFQQVEVNFLQPGDVVLYDNDGSPGLCLKVAMGIVGMTYQGCRQIEYPIIRGWRIK